MHGGHEEHSGVRVHLFDLDASQMREQLLDGVTRPDNDSSSGAHHTVRARAPFSRPKPPHLADSGRNGRSERYSLAWQVGTGAESAAW